MTNKTDKKIRKRQEIFQDMVADGRAVVVKRVPLSMEDLAFFKEKMARLKERLRKGRYFKNNSTQKFG